MSELNIFEKILFNDDEL